MKLNISKLDLLSTGWLNKFSERLKRGSRRAGLLERRCNILPRRSKVEAICWLWRRVVHYTEAGEPRRRHVRADQLFLKGGKWAVYLFFQIQIIRREHVNRFILSLSRQHKMIVWTSFSWRRSREYKQNIFAVLFRCHLRAYPSAQLGNLHLP